MHDTFEASEDQRWLKIPMVRAVSFEVNSVFVLFRVLVNGVAKVVSIDYF